MRLLTVLSLILVVSFGTISLVEAAEQKVNDFTLNDLSGKPVTLSKLEGLVILDFWATWCGPCRLIAPIVEDLANEYEGKLKVFKLDVDNNQKTAMTFGIRSIPTVVIIKNGEEVDRILGAVSKQHIVDRIKNHI